MASQKHEKIWADAIRKAVHDYITVEGEDGSKEKRRRINHLAATVVGMAMKGDMQAIKEIGERLDGKAHQGSTAEVEITHVRADQHKPDFTSIIEQIRGNPPVEDDTVH